MLNKWADWSVWGMAVWGMVVLGSVAVHAIDVTVTAKNAKNNKGNIRVAVYASKESFLKKWDITVDVPVVDKGGVAKVALPKPGKYCLVAFHDENSNGNLDMAFFIPRERAGFSNQYMPKMGPPKFEPCAIDVQDNMAITIEMR